MIKSADLKASDVQKQSCMRRYLLSIFRSHIPFLPFPMRMLQKRKIQITMQDPQKAKLPAPIHWYPQPKQSHDLSQAEPRYKTPS
jgi:hypothetical protein